MNLNSILSINRTGLNGLQNNLDNVSHNIANANTVGYKGIINSFNELMNNNLTNSDGALGNSNARVDSNTGLNAAGARVDDQVGEFETTGRALDMAINGNAFFGIIGPDGNTYLTRAGDFHRDANNGLIASNGYRVAVDAQVPEQNWPAGDLKVSSDGTIRSGDQVLGSLRLFEPNNAHSLVSVGDNLYLANGGFRAAGAGSSVMQGTLESSNVDLATQMTELLTAQRSYQMNARAASATDEMMETINHFTD